MYTDTLFLISRLDVLVAASAAMGYSCEKSEFKGTAVIFRGSFFLFPRKKTKNGGGRNEEKKM